jgi:transcriptional accessory protein Tex/SPT6
LNKGGPPLNNVTLTKHVDYIAETTHILEAVAQKKSIKKLKELVYKYNVQVISLGNGTASRESEEVLARLIKEVKEERGKELYYVVVRGRCFCLFRFRACIKRVP